MYFKQTFALLFCAVLATIIQLPARQLLLETPNTTFAFGAIKTAPITILSIWLWTHVYRYMTGSRGINPLFNIGITVAAPKAADYVVGNVLKPRQAAYDYRVIHAHACHSQLHFRSRQKLAQSQFCARRFRLGEHDAHKLYKTVTRQRTHEKALAYHRVYAEECIARKDLSLHGQCPYDEYNWEKERLAEIVMPCYHSAGFNFDWDEKPRKNDSVLVLTYKFPLPFKYDESQTKSLAVSGVPSFELALEIFEKLFD